MRWLLVLACLVACGDDDGGIGVDGGPGDVGVDTARDVGIDANDTGVDAGPAWSETLRATGFFGDDGTVADDVRPYEVRYPLWSDGVEKQRYLRLPAGTAIDVVDPDHWRFPVGTQTFKEFRVDGRLVETRLFEKRGPSDWVYVSYLWREDGSDADPVPMGATDVLGTTHDIPDTDGCFNCHHGTRDFALGIGALQLTRESFDALVTEGWLPVDAPWAEPPGNPGQAAALGYLHSNCGSCHSELHRLATAREFRARLRTADTTIDDTALVQSSLAARAFHSIDGTTLLLVAGDPDASQLWVRMGLRNEEGMPSLGSEIVDVDGLDLVRRFILRL